MTGKQSPSSDAVGVDVPLKPPVPAEVFQFSHGWFKPLLFLTGLANFSSIELFTGSEPRLVVHMSWAFKSTIPLASIRTVERVPDYSTCSAGVHTDLSGGWVVNGALNNLVVLEVDPSARAYCAFFPGSVRRLTLSVVDPERFVSSLHRAMAQAA